MFGSMSNILVFVVMSRHLTSPLISPASGNVAHRSLLIYFALGSPPVARFPAESNRLVLKVWDASLPLSVLIRSNWIGLNPAFVTAPGSDEAALGDVRPLLHLQSLHVLGTIAGQAN